MAGADPQIDPLSGGCQCGAVRYRLAEPPTGLAVCHCRMCQKASGGPFMVFGRVPMDSISWRGRPLSTFRSSSMATRGFCAACGTPLTYQWRVDAISITLGSLDDPAAFAPAERLGAESVLPWSEHVGAIPVSPTAATDATFRNYQHQDHDT